jgi:hypothetical protein
MGMSRLEVVGRESTAEEVDLVESFSEMGWEHLRSPTVFVWQGEEGKDLAAAEQEVKQDIPMAQVAILATEPSPQRGVVRREVDLESHWWDKHPMVETVQAVEDGLEEVAEHLDLEEGVDRALLDEQMEQQLVSALHRWVQPKMGGEF